MTTTPHGQVPAIQRYKIGYYSDEWGVRSLSPTGIYDDAGPWVRYEDHAAEFRRLHAYCRELESQVILDCMTHVRNPAENEHVAGDVSKNGAELDTSQQPAPATQQEAQEPVATLHCNDVGYVWARATEVGKLMRFEQPLNLYTTPQPAPATQQAGDVVAYLDVGAGGYLDLGTDLADEALSRLPKGRHALIIAGTYGIDGYTAASTPQADSQPAPDEIISMAREQGLPETEIEGVFRVNVDDLGRMFAADRAARAIRAHCC